MEHESKKAISSNLMLPAVPSTEEKTWFEKGDKIIYQYTHHLNSRSTTEIAKEGVFVRVVKRKGRSPYDWQPNRKVVVMLKGNKNESTVWESEIRHCR
jgi:hypothetical protein